LKAAIGEQYYRRNDFIAEVRTRQDNDSKLTPASSFDKLYETMKSFKSEEKKKKTDDDEQPTAEEKKKKTKPKKT
jgi:hypothetical protein